MLRAVSSTASGSGGSVPQKALASGIPFIIAPTGSMANNGAITLGTALAVIFANAYIFLPASAISAGSAAGWYFCQMSSTTVGTVFNNTYSTGIPAIPTPVAFVTTGPGAYTGVITTQNGPNVSIPAGAMGNNGILRTFGIWSCNNSAGAKNASITFGGSAIGFTAQTTNQSVSGIQVVANRGAANAQVADSGFNPAAAAGTPLYLSVNTAVAQTLAMVGQTTVATDYLVMESFLAEVIPG